MIGVINRKFQQRIYIEDAFQFGMFVLYFFKWRYKELGAIFQLHFTFVSQFIVQGLVILSYKLLIYFYYHIKRSEKNCQKGDFSLVILIQLINDD